MYQNNQNNANYPNRNARNFPSDNQQNNRQMQNERNPFGNLQQADLHQFGINPLPQNQFSPAHPLSRPTNNLHNENPFRGNAAVRMESPSTSRPLGNSVYNSPTTNFQRGQNVGQVPTQAYFAQPALLIPQNNKNFSAQCKVDRNESHLTMTRGNGVDKFETASVVSDTETVQPVTTGRLRKNENEKIRLFTGTPERIIHWHKLYNNYFCFYELIASIISVQEGPVRLQKILLLRDNMGGPVIQVIHYLKDHSEIEHYFPRMMVRCVGHMVGHNILHALSIREATPDEVTIVRRMCYIGDHAIAKALKKS